MIISLSSFHQEELGKLLNKNSKNRKKTTQRLTSATWRIYVEPNNPLAPKLDIDGGKHVLASF